MQKVDYTGIFFKLIELIVIQKSIFLITFYIFSYCLPCCRRRKDLIVIDVDRLDKKLDGMANQIEELDQMLAEVEDKTNRRLKELEKHIEAQKLVEKEQGGRNEMGLIAENHVELAKIER